MSRKGVTDTTCRDTSSPPYVAAYYPQAFMNYIPAYQHPQDFYCPQAKRSSTFDSSVTNNDFVCAAK